MTTRRVRNGLGPEQGDPCRDDDDKARVRHGRTIASARCDLCSTAQHSADTTPRDGAPYARRLSIGTGAMTSAGVNPRTAP